MRAKHSPIDVNLQQWQTLLEFSKSESVTRTSEQLEVERSTLSHRLEDLKRPGADGQAILESPSRGQLRLTAKGRRLLPAVRDLLAMHEQLLDYVNGATEQPQTVRLGLGQFAMRHYVPRAFAILRHDDAKFDVSLKLARGQERILAVASGEIDLAIVTHHHTHAKELLDGHGAGRAAITFVPLTSQALCIAASKQSPAGEALQSIARGREVPLETLARLPLVGLDEQSGIRSRMETTLRFRGDGFQFVPRTGHGGWLVAKELARTGLGAAFLPRAEIRDEDHKDMVIRDLDSKFIIEDFIVHRAGKTSQAIQATIKALASATRPRVNNDD